MKKQVSKDKFELKVDGETLTLSRDEMVKYAQLGKAGQKRMQEAVEFQKQTKTNWENLQKAIKEFQFNTGCGVLTIYNKDSV